MITCRTAATLFGLVVAIPAALPFDVDKGPVDPVKEKATVAALHKRIAAAPAPAAGKPYTQTIPGSQGVTYTMAPIPAGEFMMGTPGTEAGRSPDEGPLHKVKLEAFWMGVHEVTWDEYRLFMFSQQANEQAGADPTLDAVSRPTRPYVEMSFGMGLNGYPAISMTQHAANKYAQWLSAKTGHFYRLPTEAEWEFAARALNRQGGAKVRFATGRDSISPAEANYNPNDPAPKPWALPGTYRKRTLHADSLGVNSLGFRHLSGNVWEWCWDWFDKSWYAQSEGATDPRGPDYGNFRICRGGSFGMPAAFCRAACRAWGAPADRTSYVGFRVARSGP